MEGNGMVRANEATNRAPPANRHVPPRASTCGGTLVPRFL
jgi:hypothetical protein